MMRVIAGALPRPCSHMVPVIIAGINHRYRDGWPAASDE